MRILQTLCYIHNKTFEITLDKCTIIVKLHNNNIAALNLLRTPLIIKKQRKQKTRQTKQRTTTKYSPHKLSIFTSPQ